MLWRNNFTKRVIGGLLAILVIVSVVVLEPGVQFHLIGAEAASSTSSSFSANKQLKSRVPVAKPLWSVTLGESASFDERDKRSAAMDGSVFYLQNGQLQAASLRTGKVFWKRGKDLDAPLMVRNSALGGSEVLAATKQTGVVYSFDAASGKVRWTYKTGQSSGSSEIRVVQHMTTDGQNVYLVTRGAMSLSRLTALDARTGKVLWSQKQAFFRDEVHVTDSLLIVGVVEDGALTTNTFYAYDKKSGKQRWKLSGSYGSVLTFRAGKLYVPRAYPYAASDQYEVELDVIDMQTGKVLQTNTYVPLVNSQEPLVNGGKQLRVDGDDLYIQSSRGILHVVDLLDDTDKKGTVLLDTARHQMRWLAGPHAGRLYMWDDAGQRMTFLKTATLQTLGVVGPRNPISQLQLVQAAAFVGQSDGELVAMNVLTGNSAFRFQTGGSEFAPFQVSGKTLLVETDERLFAFELPKSLLADLPAENPAVLLTKSNVKVNFAGKVLTLQKPVRGNQRKVYVPLKDMVLAAGYQLSAGKAGGYVLKKGNATASLAVGVREAFVNQSAKRLAGPPLSIEGSLYVDYRDAALLLGVGVTWDGGKRVVDYQ